MHRPEDPRNRDTLVDFTPVRVRMTDQWSDCRKVFFTMRAKLRRYAAGGGFFATLRVLWSARSTPPVGPFPTSNPFHPRPTRS